MSLSSRIRTMGAPHWLALFSLIALGWVLLYAMALPPEAMELSRIYGAEFWRSLCIVAPDQAGFAGLVAMWVVMSAVMMAPTALPSFATYDDLIASGAGSRRGFGELVGAGAYQFLPLKEACLSKCRQPMSFFMQHWRQARWNAFALGVRLGATCLGFCWALMLLGFVGGVMNLAFMGLATLIMIFEKLPDLGRYLTRPLGAVVMAGGVLALVTGG